jgi:CubicO group peptidase (beta-lactamase class C family)
MIAEVDSGGYVDIHSVLVAKHGALVLEQYFDGHDRDTLHEIRSATKSIGSILTGIAIDRGYISSEREFVYRFFENDYEPANGWTKMARAVEIRHLLSMMSGYDCDDLATSFGCERAMYDSDDWVRYSLGLPFAHPPGAHWAYNSSSLILVGEVVARRSGMKLDDFADRYLFEPLGIEEFRWEHSPKGRAWIGGGARMIPREMARIGQLMLSRGVWNGERLLSESWIDKSTARQGEMNTGVDYGYLWQSGETYIGREIVRAFWASGNGGQYIIVIPSQGMVVVFTGGNYDSPLAGQPFGMLTRQILPAFMRPGAFDDVALTEQEAGRLIGTYSLEFEPAAKSKVAFEGGHLRLLSPDNQWIELVAHSSTFFTGDSSYGPVTVVFEADERYGAIKLTIYGSFQRFVFEHDERASIPPGSGS